MIPILQKAAAIAVLPQIQRIYLRHLLHTEAGKYNSQNLQIGYIVVICQMVEVDRAAKICICSIPKYILILKLL